MSEEVTPHPAVAALDVFVSNGQGRTVRGLVSCEALETHFGAGPSPDSWLVAYRANESVIDAMIRHKANLHPHLSVVVVVANDFVSG